MKISVFGLGYVGSVVCACLSKLGHEIVGVDVRPEKVAMLNDGRSPVFEGGVQELIEASHRAGRIRATPEAAEAVLATDLSMICVGTPSSEDGDLDLTAVARVSEQIGEALREKGAYHVVVVRSTMFPGSVEGCVIPALEAGSGKTAGKDFGVVFNPEFLREASAVHDFFHPPKTVIGELRTREGEVAASLYAHLDAPLIRTSLRSAEMVKYVDNVFHALKITFANEIGSLCKACGVDSHEVMDIFCQDRKLNISPAYLRPGFAFGGSCLPKDLRALTAAARQRGVSLPLLANVAVSNDELIRRAHALVRKRTPKRVAFLGLAFKPGTDDLRESPIVRLVQQLLADGIEVTVYDPGVNASGSSGTGQFMLARHEELVPLLQPGLADALAGADVVVVGHASQEFTDALSGLTGPVHVLDLAHIPDPRLDDAATYEGICW